MVGRSAARARKSGVIVQTQYEYAVRVSSHPHTKKECCIAPRAPAQSVVLGAT
jgi:hypothetical protein